MRDTVPKSTHDSSALLQETWARSEVLRHRLARRLHDDVCGQLIGSLMDLTLIRNSLPPASAELSGKLQRSCDVLSAAVRANRELVEELRPSLLDNVGLFAALKWRVVEACRSADVPCSQRLPVDEPQLEPEVGLGLFRLAEESLQLVMTQQKRIDRIELHASQSAKGLTITIATLGEVVPAAQQELADTLRLKLMDVRAALAGAVIDLRYPASGGASITLSTGAAAKD